MTAPSGAIRKADLHAYVDGQLDAARRQDVEAHLAANPEAAARVRAYRHQNRALRAVLAPVLDEPLPRGLKPPRDRRKMVHAIWAVAAAVMLLVGGVAGWQLRGLGLPEQGGETRAVVDQAVIAHAVFTPQRRHPVEVGANEEAHLVGWLSKVLGAPLRAPHLAEFDYALVGGRLLSAPSGPAAQFMYETPGKQRLTLYVVNDLKRSGTTEFHFAEQQGVSVFYWVDGPLGYALTAAVPKAELFKVAQSVHRQLERK